MIDLRQRLGSRAAAPFGLLLAVAIVAAACSSTAGNSPHSAAGSVLSNASAASPSTMPEAVAAATATPVPVATSSGTMDTDAAADAQALQSTMVAVIKKVTPQVVVIETASGLGSGVVYDQVGHIITNAHVVGTSKTFKVTLASGKVYTGTLVGSFPADDIAVIKIPATGLTPAVFGDSSKLSVGDFVLAMGNPLGFQSSVTEGIVSALGRSVPEPNGNALPDVIQTSAAINPGNSGGALVDLAGEVVGIPTLAATDPQVGGSAPGIGFAISSNRARQIADQLIASGHVTSSGRAYLGVELQDSSLGVLVYSTASGGPAEKAGIVANDLILSINGSDTPDSSTLAEIMIKLKPGDVASVAIQHQNGSKVTIKVTLGELPG
jgi:S1-C subfamily serine protease